MDASTRWAIHYDPYNIKLAERYANKAYKLNRNQNRMRISLYANHLPLNAHQHYVMNKNDISPSGDDSNCKEQQLEETMHHYMLVCQNIFRNEG